MEEISIRAYDDACRRQVIDHILFIQREEFGVPIRLSDQPDLQNITGFYQAGGGNFWLAIHDNNVVGTIALLNIGHSRGALRKMFVKQAYRGKPYSLGQALLNTLLKWAAENGYKEILLGTTEKFLAAQRFYEKNGFRLIEKTQLPPEFPVMIVDVKFYTYVLT